MVWFILVVSFVVIISGALLVVLPEDEKSEDFKPDGTIIDSECW